MLKKRYLLALVAYAGAVLVVACLGGCAQSASAPDSASEGALAQVRIGTMPTEDMLPAWVAEDAGYFADEGLDVSIQTFDSAQSLSAAIAAGQVDMAMTDVMRAVKLCESGTPVVAEWVTLGTDAAQGRFGVLAPADAEYGSLAELAAWVATKKLDDGAGVGLASNTVPEYVFDMLCQQEGIAPGEIPVLEVASLPERYGLTASGQLLASALPNSLLTLGEESGMKVIAADTAGANVSQSIMVATERFAAEHADGVDAVARAWDKAVDDIDKDPAAFKDTLFANASINADIKDAYEVSAYPFALADGKLFHPESDLVWSQIEWMRVKGYGGQGVSYDGSTGAFQIEG